ncbi:MAG: hypothetical protein IIB60_04325 [Planctomycetes bacterium]|nr:hypothetical protein [Planctomycetota bacterium]
MASLRVARVAEGLTMSDPPSTASLSDMPADELAQYNDFARKRNVSYDSLNLCGPTPNLRPAPTMAYMSDPNPLFIGGRFQETVDPTHANSPAHGGRGQTVLLIDGSTRKLTSPIYGADRDNLWLVGNIRRYTGTETPTDAHDAFLIPGYPSTDLPSGLRPAN